MDLSNLTPSEWAVLIVAGTGFLGFILSIYNTRVQATKLAVEQLQKLLETYRLENEKLLKSHEELVKELGDRDHLIRELKNWIERLTSQVVRIGEPGTRPEKYMPLPRE